MKKREFIKLGFAGMAGLISLPGFAGKLSYAGVGSKDGFALPDLPYGLADLEPHFSRETMKTHYLQHHAQYASQLKSALAAGGIRPGRPRTILKEASRYSDRIVSLTGEFVNHKIFWRSLSPQGGGQPSGQIAGLIRRDFGSYARFRKRFEQAVANHSGSGWIWLVIRNKKLRVVATDNHENPLLSTLPASKQGHPLFGIDMWEHAYYLNYQDDRRSYVNAFWKVIDWRTVNHRLTRTRQA